MKVRKLLEIQSTIEERKVPCDMNGELNKHYSESKEKEIDILDMDLIHLVRSYSKIIGKKYNYIDTENKQIISDSIDTILENINEVNRVLSE
jgi:archaellum component FlaC